MSRTPPYRSDTNIFDQWRCFTYIIMMNNNTSRPSVPSCSKALSHGSGKDRVQAEGAKNHWVGIGCQRRRLETNMDTNLPAPSKKCLNIMHWNAEGVHKKKVHLAKRLSEEKIDIACIQETHLTDTIRFSTRGYQIFRYDRIGRSKGGVMMLIKNDYPAEVKNLNTNDHSEIQEANIIYNNTQIKIFNVYCPPDKDLNLHVMSIPEERCLILGDFNSHSEMWGYDQADKRGEEVEDWQIDNKIALLNDPEDHPTFYSRRWCTTSSPDLAFATDDFAKISTRKIDHQLSTSDHRPVIITVDFNSKPEIKKALARWNFKKADWNKYGLLSDLYLEDIRDKTESLNNKVEKANKSILKAAQESIPRGCRKNYCPFWTQEIEDAEKCVDEARKSCEENPSIDNNIAFKASSARLKRITANAAKSSWERTTANLQYEKEGHKLWKLCKALNGDVQTRGPTTLKEGDNLTYGKEAARKFVERYEKISQIDTTKAEETETKKLYKATNNVGTREMNVPFTIVEFETALNKIKEKRAPGIDGITGEMLKHLGSKGKKKLLQLFNESWKTGVIPQIWKDAETIRN